MLISKYLFIIFWTICNHVDSKRVLLIGENTETQLVDLFKEAKDIQVSTEFMDHEEEDEMKQNETFCKLLNGKSIAAVIDFSWGGWQSAKQLSEEYNIPYIRVEVTDIILTPSNAQSP